MCNNILVVAAHPDDEVLGCGGTIRKYAETGCNIHVIILAEGITSRDRNRSRKNRMNEINALAESANKAAKLLGIKSVKMYNYPDNRMDSVPLLEIVKVIESCIAEYEPEMVLTHHESDLNIDHKIVNLAVVTACRPLPNQTVKTILFFEVPSSTGWHWSTSAIAFIPNWFIDISATLQFKLRALKEYNTELRKWPHARSIEAVKYLAKWRGSSVGVDSAEAFVLGKNLLV